jgi:glycosyltransferase involved in cell wall biosynthesis
MRVLFCVGFPINLDNEISGTGNWILSLIKNILLFNNEEPITVAVCYVDPKIKDTEHTKLANFDLFKIPSFQNNKIKILASNYGIYDSYQNLTKNVDEVILNFNPNIIQIFGYESQFVRIIDKIDVPTIIHFQGFKRSIDYKYFQRISKRELYSVFNLKDFIFGSIPFFSKRKSKITSYINLFDCTKVKHVLGRTDWDRLITKAVSPNAVYYYCQEILRNSFYNSEWVYKENEVFSLFTITGAGATKNVDMIFEVDKLLAKYHPSFKYIWRVAGVDGKNTVPKIMSKRGFKSNNLKLLGKLSSDELISELHNCNLYVYPSGMDNSPNALMEAMLMGVPVLSNHAGGISSIVEHGKTGFLVTEGEPYAMTGAIVSLAEQKNFLKLLGKNSRKASLERNEPKNVIRQLLNAYHNILNKDE